MKTITTSITLSDGEIDMLATALGHETNEDGPSAGEFVAAAFKQEVAQRVSNILAQDVLKEIDEQVAAQKEQAASAINAQVNEQIEITIDGPHEGGNPSAGGGNEI